MNFIIGVKGNFSVEAAAANLKKFLNENAQSCDLQILAFSGNPLSAIVAIPEDKRHNLRISLNIFAAETNIHWTLETE